jgi:hypothetical protein
MGQSDWETRTSIFIRLANALIEATPEWWSAAELELVTPPEGFGSGLLHTIASHEFPHDIVVPTDELMEATRALELASIKDGDQWRRCLIRVVQEPPGQWRYTAEFERDA